MTISFLDQKVKKPEKTTLVRVRLNSQGYTESGYYFGNGPPLFWYVIPTHGENPKYIEGHIRARDREGAKQELSALYPRRRLEFYV